MTPENEKLRALLAEARSGYVGHNLDCSTNVCDECSLTARIDAALAEPVVRCGECNGELTESRPGRHQCVTCETSRVVGDLIRERDEARAELDFIKAEYGDVDDEALTRDALVLKLRLRESELESESASRRVYERQHEDVWAALKKAGADAYHPEDGEPVVLWGVERLAKERDEARAEVERLRDKAIRFDLDKAGIESRERDAVALVEARAEVERLSTWGPLKRLRTEMEEAAQAAYRRGAEAMREAAVSACWALSDELASVPDTLGEQQTAWGAATRIRALPLPEDR